MNSEDGDFGPWPAGWVCLPPHYDDSGYNSANLERLALQRLLADIQAGTIDAVVRYKMDRLSRSLMDIARMAETFECSSVACVAVTQQFNSTTSMGRLVLNVLLWNSPLRLIRGHRERAPLPCVQVTSDSTFCVGRFSNRSCLRASGASVSIALEGKRGHRTLAV